MHLQEPPQCPSGRCSSSADPPATPTGKPRLSNSNGGQKHRGWAHRGAVALAGSSRRTESQERTRNVAAAPAHGCCPGRGKVLGEPRDWDSKGTEPPRSSLRTPALFPAPVCRGAVNQECVSALGWQLLSASWPSSQMFRGGKEPHQMLLCRSLRTLRTVVARARLSAAGRRGGRGLGEPRGPVLLLLLQPEPDPLTWKQRRCSGNHPGAGESRDCRASVSGGADPLMLDQNRFSFAPCSAFAGPAWTIAPLCSCFPAVSWDVATGPVQLPLKWDVCSLARKTQAIRRNQPTPTLSLPV